MWGIPSHLNAHANVIILTDFLFVFGWKSVQSNVSQMLWMLIQDDPNLNAVDRTAIHFESFGILLHDSQKKPKACYTILPENSAKNAHRSRDDTLPLTLPVCRCVP